MIYKIKDNYYLKVQGYYKKINFILKGNDLAFSVNDDNKIELGAVKSYEIINMNSEQDKKRIIDTISRKDKETNKIKYTNR